MPATESGRRVVDGLLVLSAGALACATAIVPPHPESPVQTLVMAVIAIGLLIGAVVRRSPPAIRATVSVSAVVVIFAVGALLAAGPVITTVAVSAIPLLVLVLLDRRTAWRPALPWLRVGRLDPWVWVLAGATVAVAAAALAVFATLVRPEVSPYLTMLRSMPIWAALLGIVGFAVVNPVWEEVLYRGVLQGELACTLGSRPALVLQAVLFGLAHLHGFPSGWLGVLMAATWGFGLGVIRRRTGGILVGYLVHVAADLSIGVLAVVLLR